MITQLTAKFSKQDSNINVSLIVTHTHTHTHTKASIKMHGKRKFDNFHTKKFKK